MQYQKLIIDGPYLARRSYGAPYKLTTSKGLDSTLIHSFMRTLKSLHKQFNPKEIIITWESHGTKSWRREMLPSYKPRSGSVGNEYYDELRDLQVLLHLLNIKQYYSPNNEADDVIARLTVDNQGKFIKDENILIFTVDKDIMQLVNSFIHIWNGKEMITEETVMEKFGVKPHQIPDYLAIVGDTSDNIKGIDKYGPKKARNILSDYGDIDNIPNSQPLYQYLQKLTMNKRLTLLNRSCVLETIPNENFKSEKTLISLLDKYELKKVKENIEAYKLIGGRDE